MNKKSEKKYKWFKNKNIFNLKGNLLQLNQ